MSLKKYCEEVILLFLISATPIRITGTFDRATLDAVRAAQRQFGLTADGIVGRNTWNAVYDAFEGLVNAVLVPKMNIQNFPGKKLSVGDSDFESGGENNE